VVQQRRQPRPIARLEPDRGPGESTLQHRELMAQTQNPHVLVAVAASQQSQQRKRVRETQVRQPQQHDVASSLMIGMGEAKGLDVKTAGELHECNPRQTRRSP
jgi:hypothetical protein